MRQARQYNRASELPLHTHAVGNWIERDDKPLRNHIGTLALVSTNRRSAGEITPTRTTSGRPEYRHRLLHGDRGNSRLPSGP